MGNGNDRSRGGVVGEMETILLEQQFKKVKEMDEFLETHDYQD